VTVDEATLNGLRVVDLLNRGDVPVAKGLANPLVRDAVRATSFHGKDGLGDSHLPLPRIHPADKTALDTISDELEVSNRRELIIICTGPLTNVAALLTSFPESGKMIREIGIMGGAYGITEHGVGNVTSVAEFNVYADPEAAKIVFESRVPLRAVGLDVTMIPENQLSLKDYARIRKSAGKVPAFASAILRKNVRKHGIFALHDPMTVAAKVKPSLFKFDDYNVQVETKGEITLGMTVADRRPVQATSDRRENVMVCKSVDSMGFKRLFFDRLIYAPRD
jgi:inosine-uridine nucleoside N-ribohydrolase